MQNALVANLIQVLLGMLTPDVIKRVADSLLDIVEDAIANSDTDIDDKIALPLIQAIRAAFDIPDNDVDRPVKL